MLKIIKLFNQLAIKKNNSSKSISKKNNNKN